jgi:probable DNA metabolism protein
VRQSVRFTPDFEGWRGQARTLLLTGVEPSLVDWHPAGSAQAALFTSNVALFPVKGELKLPAEFVRLASAVACVRGEEQWPVLYRFAWRLLREGAHLLQISTDSDLLRLRLWEKAIRRDIHKMHAFVRFKEKEGTYVAWYKPDNRILREAAPFFARRYGDKPFTIFTPDGSAIWDLKKLNYGDGLAGRDFTTTDTFDEAWKEYYKSTFNPARVNVKLMQKEMPKRFWANLPEASVIESALREAPKRVQKMAEVATYLAAPPAIETLPELAAAARTCESCPLYSRATQTVFGIGPARAPLFIVGEQPGDEEDKQGNPFVGPAGAVLRDALAQAGVPEGEIYLTNAVKHFKWVPGDRPSKLRIHKTPSGSDVSACKPWLEKEIALVKPKVLLALGRTAGLSLLGRLPLMAQERGRPLESHREQSVMLSWHPAAILRAFDEPQKAERFGELVHDLRAAWEAAGA